MKSVQSNSRSIVNMIGVPFLLTSIYFINFFKIVVLIILLFCLYELFSLVNHYNNKYKNYIFFLLSVFWLICAFGYSLFFFISLEDGIIFTYVLFISIWVCDTFAYIFGSKYGKKKIFPSISPNKTILGTISGIVGVAIVIIGFKYLIDIYGFSIELEYSDMINLIIIIGIIGQLGDFFESFLKRKANIKDTSSILMGHGGFLDRFDSISFAAPIYYLYILYFII